jgi:hypothetical protein
MANDVSKDRIQREKMREFRAHREDRFQNPINRKKTDGRPNDNWKSLFSNNFS